MPDDQIPTFVVPRQHTVKIVGSYLRKNQLSGDQLATLIATVHRTLAVLGKSPVEDLEPPLTPAVPVRQSVSQDQVVCLDCGWKGKILRGHLARHHALTPKEYRARWNLKSDHPLTAPAYSENRSAFAKRIGLGQAAKASRGRTRRSRREGGLEAQS